MALFLTRTRGRPSRPTRRLRSLAPARGRRAQPGPAPIALVSPVANGTHHERPEPTMRWTDAHHVPGGDFCARAIANAAVTPDVVPVRGDAWDTVREFALSYDGYAYWDDLPELAARVLQRWTRDRALPETLDELRGCLFYEHRRWHHFGQDPAGRSATYIWALLDALFDLLSSSDQTTDGPTDPRPRRAPEAHVRIVPAPSAVPDAVVAAHPSALAPTITSVGQPAPLGVVAGLEPPDAARAHVRLVSAIEGESGVAAAVAAGHPSVWRAPANGQTRASVHELRPMPSADPLPKPSVIEPRVHPASVGAPRTAETTRRGRPAGSARANGGVTNGGVANGSRANGSQANGSQANGSQANAGQGNGVQANAGQGNGGQGNGVAIRTFAGDDAAFRAWMEAHPEGFVLSRPRTPRAKAMTLHRVGCPVLSGLAVVGAGRGRDLAADDPDTDDASTRAPRACGPSALALAAWSRARGDGEPVPCRRCHR